MHKILMLILSGMASFAATAATTYYVAPNGYAGDAADDGNHGTREKPFATIAYAYPKLKTAGTNSELVLLSGTHLITSRISNGMGTYDIIRGETGDPKDVTLDFGNLADACLLVADIQLHDVTVINANADIDSKGGALRVQSTMGTADSSPAFVSNCVFTACKSCAITVVHPGQVLDCTFRENEFSSDTGKYKSLIYFVTDGSENNSIGTRIVRGCRFIGNASSGDGCCINASCNWNPVVIESCAFTNNVSSGSGADVFVGNKAIIIGSSFKGSSAGSVGGSVCMKTKSSLSVTNCTFDACSASRDGGSFYMYENSSLSLVDCMFESCTSSMTGGAIASTTNATVYIEDTRFIGNKAEKTGGAIRLLAATGTVVRCSAIGNESLTQSAGFARIGARSKMTVVDSVFSNNVAAADGGVFYQDIPDKDDPHGTLELIGSELVGNKALCKGREATDNYFGGGALALGSKNVSGRYAPLFVDRCVFRNNETVCSGGAIYMRNDSTVNASRVDIRNSLFEGNSAGYYGGAINLVAKNASVDNCTFITNVATKSGPHFYHRWTSYFRNCIFVSDKDSSDSDAFCGQNANPQLYLNSIQVGRTDANMLACFTAANGCTNLTMAEIGRLRFADFANGDYSLNAGGIARNKGRTLDWMSDAAECLDLAGNARVYPKLADGGMVDIGCYECALRNGLSLIIR